MDTNECNSHTPFNQATFLNSMNLAFSNSSLLFWIKDANQKYILLNPAFLQLLKKKEKDFLHLNDQELHETSFIRFFYNPFNEKTSKDFFYLKLEIKKKVFFFKVNYNEVRNNQNEIIFTTFLGENITQEKLTKQKIAQREFELSILQTFAAQTARQLDIPFLVENTAKAMRQLVNASNSYILLYNEKNDSMRDISRPFWNRETNEKVECYGALKAYNTKLPYFCKSSEHPDFSIRKYLLKNNIKAIQCLPIFYNEEVFAVLLMTFKTERTLSENDLKIIATLCDHLSILLQNSIIIKESLKELNDRLKAEKDIDEIFNETRDILLLADDQGYFKRINPACSQILGYSEEELVAVPYLTYVHPDDKKNTEKVIFNIDNSPTIADFQNRYIHKNGSLVILQWKAKFFKEGRYFIATARDVTQQIDMERQNNELQRTLELEKLRTEFFANLSHELKTPLNIIMSASDLLQSKLEIAKHKIEVTDVIKLNKYTLTNAYRLYKLIINLLDLSKLDAGNYVIHPTNLEFVSFISNIISSTHSYCERKQIGISFSSTLSRCIVNCDPNFIDRIILNLISNAVKYSLPHTHIQVSISQQSKWILIQVQDEGIGIGKDELTQIFDRFHRVDNSIHRSQEGSGIGLSIVKSLVTMHQGSIKIQSKVNKGTLVSIKLPYNPQLQDQTITTNDEDYSAISQYHLNVEFSDLKL